jgi:hypothetical protein
MCLRRYRRAPQAFPGDGGRRRRAGSAEPQCGQRLAADAGPAGWLAAGHAGGVRGGLRLGVAGGAAGGLRVRGAPKLVHPLRCKAIASARLKNDKVDAATLAQLLRADLLPEAWIAPPEVRALRALLLVCYTMSGLSWPADAQPGRPSVLPGASIRAVWVRRCCPAVTWPGTASRSHAVVVDLATVSAPVRSSPLTRASMNS